MNRSYSSSCSTLSLGSLCNNLNNSNLINQDQKRNSHTGNLISYTTNNNGQLMESITNSPLSTNSYLNTLPSSVYNNNLSMNLVKNDTDSNDQKPIIPARFTNRPNQMNTPFLTNSSTLNNSFNNLPQLNNDNFNRPSIPPRK